ncbi:type I-F CRISPR-associated protein Csy1 [uncultured Endozoicomonas sp.]|uniref:type I-F CRISPR-associated protein Csy1 n=1 Tax=uncultured Endozoicomonas sp. TaxID=432652 RepID=UPI0026127BF8|nr:type I-F CRISPR-associated protein Csy1 [uncultured Endozoicomonas sp.]
MNDAAVIGFFRERKEAWLKKTIKPAMDENEVLIKKAECEQLFSLEEWLPNAAKRAGQISISSHPCTFSHPSSRKSKNGYTTSVIAQSQSCSDGFLRSGNVEVQSDALGNAAALDVYKFLSLITEDGKTLLTHLEADSDLARALLSTQKTSYEVLKQGFMEMMQSGSESITSSKIKQVYFPVGNDYHLLSLLTPSGIVFDLRKRLDVMRFGDEIKQARENRRNNTYQERDYREIYGLTTIGWGGTKPQNISVLNNQNGGKAHLLPSLPPELKKRNEHFPKQDFFTQSVRYQHCVETFQSLHNLYSKDHNNRLVRAARDEFYLSIMDYIVTRMWQLRAVAGEQYNPDYHQLSKAQRIWLLEEHAQAREDSDDWLDDITGSITQFIFHGYEKMLGKKAIKFSDTEQGHIAQLIVQHREVLR